MPFQKWIVEIKVDDTWVADGFDLTQERAHEMVRLDLRHAHSSEVKTKIIHAPPRHVINKLQGG